MGRSILVAVLAAGVALLATTADTKAQQISPAPRPYAPPLVGTEPPPENAPVYGATYIPGVGYRYLAPGSPRVYGPRFTATTAPATRAPDTTTETGAAPIATGPETAAGAGGTNGVNCQPASLTTEISGASSFFMPCT